MTYEFAKYVADNLRFGSYKDRIIEFKNSAKVRIKDINSNTYIEFICPEWTEFKKSSSNLSFNKTKYSCNKIGLSIYVNTGTINPNEECETAGYNIGFEHPDYVFWEEFLTFIKAAYEDKVYKHRCLIEDAFVL